MERTSDFSKVTQNWTKENLEYKNQSRVFRSYCLNGRVYLMDKETGEEGKVYERVVCLNAQNGDIIWKFLYPVNYKDMDTGRTPVHLF